MPPTDWRLWAALGAAAVASYIPRGAGVLLAGRVNPEGAAFRWIGCVAYGLLAALIGRMILSPAGPLTETALSHRLAAVAVALAAFFIARRSLPAGAVAGVALLAALTGAGGH